MEKRETKIDKLTKLSSFLNSEGSIWLIKFFSRSKRPLGGVEPISGGHATFGGRALACALSERAQNLGRTSSTQKTSYMSCRPMSTKIWKIFYPLVSRNTHKIPIDTQDIEIYPFQTPRWNTLSIPFRSRPVSTAGSKVSFFDRFWT